MRCELTELKLLGCMTPALLSLWIGASRIYDNDHHPADVVGGWMLGGGRGLKMPPLENKSATF